MKPTAKKHARQSAWRRRNPWARLLEFARRRCRENSHYVKRAIRCTLTGEQMKILWERDGGAGMKRPSLDRKDPTAGYAFENCRVLEFWLNVRAPHDPRVAAMLSMLADVPESYA